MRRKIIMRNKNLITAAMTVVMAGALLAGCGKTAEAPAANEPVAIEETAVIEETANETPLAETVETTEAEATQELEPGVFESQNGWKVHYNPDMFEVSGDGPETFFVYMGDSAGTNMIEASYTVEGNAEAVINEIAKSSGDKTEVFERNFPGKNENISGWCASLPVDGEGSGYYMTAFARDYMDGALVFRIDGHMGEDEDMNMTVYDYIAEIMDSIEFPYENN